MEGKKGKGRHGGGGRGEGKRESEGEGKRERGTGAGEERRERERERREKERREREYLLPRDWKEISLLDFSIHFLFMPGLLSVSLFAFVDLPSPWLSQESEGAREEEGGWKEHLKEGCEKSQRISFEIHLT